ncbi:24818_t:CDS:2, partial [Gigaspora rosea]
VEIAYLSIDLLSIGTSNDDYECKDCKSRQKGSPKPRKKRPTCLKPRIGDTKMETYEPYQESVVINLEEDKEKDRQLETKKKESKNQQRSMDINLDDENQKTLLHEMIDEIDVKNDIPKERIESLTVELNRATTIKTNSQSAKKLKSLKDDRTNVLYDPGISCQEELDLVKNDQLTKNIEATYHLRNANFGIEVELEAHEIFNSFQELATNNPEMNRWYPEYEIAIKRNKTHDIITLGLYYREEIGLEKAYEEWRKKISKILYQVEKDEHEVFKDHKRLTELDEDTQVKDKPRISYYCPKYMKIRHVNETIERYFKIEADIGHNIINNLERTCKDWKKRVKTLKKMTKEYKDKDLNETKKQEEYELTNLNHICAT